TLQAVIRDVRVRVADGTGLAQAMERHPRVFNDLAVSMIRAGQEGGFLEDVLKRVAAFVEGQEDLKAKVIGSLAYPVFLAVAGFSVVAILMTFFVPKFEPMFAKLREKGEMPTVTSMLMSVSGFFASWQGFLTAFLMFLGLIGFFVWTRMGGRRWA